MLQFRVALFFLLIFLGLENVSSYQKDFKGTLEHEGHKRIYLLHVPPVAAKKTVPLVIVLHGGGGNGDGAATMSGMSEKADREGFLVVYPYGTGRFKERLLTWNAGQCCGSALDEGVDDVGFIRMLIDTLVSTRSVDPRRVYVTGMSNGAMMAYRLGCELSDRIAAIAPVAGSFRNTGCRPSHPVSVIIFHGTADKHVPYNGGRGSKRADSHDRCPSPLQSTVKENIIREFTSGGMNDSAVEVYTIKGGTRGWILGDKPTTEISATDLMWEFFKRHAKP